MKSMSEEEPPIERVEVAEQSQELLKGKSKIYRFQIIQKFKMLESHEPFSTALIVFYVEALFL